MTALLGKAGKKLFEQHLESYAPADPLYETYTDEQGRQKRRKRELPPGLSKRDAAILRSVKRRAHHLDKGFSLCGMRFGWTFVISLIPVVGDCADAILNYTLVVRKARQAELPQWLVSRMLFNNAVSFGVSFIPFAGDIFLAVYKANSRNAALLEEFLRIRGEEYLKLHPNAEEEAANAKKGKGFGSWFRKKSTAGEGSTSAGESSTAGAKGKMPAKDLEQVKPGSGLEPGEVPQINTEYVGDDIEAQRALGQSSAQPERTFFGRGSSRKSSHTGSPHLSPELNQATDRQSRFIENVSTSSATPSTSSRIQD